MENKDIRWKQRFQNFEKCFQLLEDLLKKENFTEVDQIASIKCFEMAFELAWNTLGDYLALHGKSVKFPRDIIKESFQHELISEGETWLDMLEKRNLMAHSYDEAKALVAITKIRNEYGPALKELYLNFKNKC